MSQTPVWRSAFSEAELAEIAAAPPDSLVARLARLLDQQSPEIPDRSEFYRLRELPMDGGNIRRMDEV